MKLLTITIPCYNSSGYMRKSIESCLKGGDVVEVIIVNDGSVDDTAQIADDYAAKYPSIVKVIHQPNKGHGGAVNAGLKAATGYYFKVVDSDDWLNTEALMQVIDQLAKFVANGTLVDMLVSDFVYEQENILKKKKMKYKSIIPVKQIVGWEDLAEFKKRQYLLMHSLIFSTEVLKKSGLELPEHTFYVDNLFVFVPLQQVSTLYYLDVPLYRYFIGRDDQSITETMMMKRIDQQIKVNQILIDVYGQTSELNPKLNDYLVRHIQVVTLISIALLNKMDTHESLMQKQALWNYLKKQSPEAYQQISQTILARILNIKGRKGKKISNTLYKAARKVSGYS
ncbi:glycosyltransferase family 2 protein [Fundicoccus sp. Sow4_F4]|uniref:glycosyltransferase family 2 protein n=1 Tax=Fundicoccus sp. Sow4_F4 TaxID=3438783 RepID=UPI003F8E6C98